MGESLQRFTTNNDDPFSEFYLYEPGPEGLKHNRGAYPRMWGILLAQIVEIPDASNRRDRISRLYKLAHEYEFKAPEMNVYYEQALTGMLRERGVADEIDFATTALTGERVQVWPPDMDVVDMLHRVVINRPEGSRSLQLKQL